MKHLFIYILCSILCCGAYAQTNAQSPPPGVKFRTMKAEKAMRSGKFGKKDAFMQQQKASKTAPQAKIQNDLRRNRIGKPAAVQAPRLQSAKAIEGDQARITLYVQTDWGDGSGYQLILDKECEITGTTSLDEIFAAADYTLPSNAAVLENFLKAGESASVDIPAGEYDFYVFNPTPSDGTVYIAGGEAVGDNFEFKGGVEYVFTINVDLTAGDNVEITTDSPVEIGVSEIISPVSGRDLSAEESITARIFNNGTEEVTSFTATYTLDGGQPVSETVNTAIAPGGSIDYTFTSKADFSAAGVHSLAVSVEHEKDGLPTNNSVTARIIHIAAVEAPYVCAFDNESCINEWTIIDANNDGSTWTISLDEQCAKVLYNSLNKTDDYLVTVCPIILDAGTNNIALEYNAMSSSYYESFEILYGKTSNVNEMTVLKKYENFPASEEKLTAIVNFDTEEAGEYFFAIHATSEADQMGFEIYNVAISEGAYTGEPDLTLDKVIMPLPSCSLGDAEKVSAKISNKGTAGAIGFTLEYSVNGEAKGRYFITSITLKLAPGQMQPPLYASLQSYLDDHHLTSRSPATIRAAVIAIRSGKLPDPAEQASAGSFFKNIHFTSDTAKAAAEAQGIPVFGTPSHWSLSSGWLIEHAGLKGQLLHGMRVSSKAALILINESAQSYADLAAARQEIRAAVKAKFGYELEQEPEELI